MSNALLEIDGSYGEGGGQVLRTSLALSLLTGRPFRLTNVRARRSKPGLQPQHLTSVRAAATVGQATLRGASLGSSDLTFEPGEVRAGNYRFDVGTAGATSLVLHTVYLPLALRGQGPSELTLIGGTHVSHSPAFHFLDATWRRYLDLCGLRLRLKMARPGFYPRGGGLVEAVIQPCAALRGARLGNDTAVPVRGTCAVAGLPDHIAHRQVRRARYRLEDAGIDCDLREEAWQGGPGNVVVLEAQTTPVPTVFTATGARGVPAETVADEAVAQVRDYLATGQGRIDEHSADQMVLPLALADGPSVIATHRVTQHLTTNVWVIRRFVERDVVVSGDEGGPGEVRIE
jgi:RNA 3'-terminal phosphate cyclase (ATP)